MANSTDREYSVAPGRTAAPSGKGIWMLGTALVLAALAWFALALPLSDSWVDSDWMLALPVLWLAGLIWKGARRG
jgi:hypothetical protein